MPLCTDSSHRWRRTSRFAVRHPRGLPWRESAGARSAHCAEAGRERRPPAMAHSPGWRSAGARPRPDRRAGSSPRGAPRGPPRRRPSHPPSAPGTPSSAAGRPRSRTKTGRRAPSPPHPRKPRSARGPGQLGRGLGPSSPTRRATSRSARTPRPRRTWPGTARPPPEPGKSCRCPEGRTSRCLEGARASPCRAPGSAPATPRPPKGHASRPPGL
mmetsp:Transcript_55596/g.159929  ORF Transcript_55596/g.159929 Transcript_55596/m.159929 type:complete len:214 (-) Transcript_55596:51-692(-)